MPTPNSTSGLTSTWPGHAIGKRICSSPRTSCSGGADDWLGGDSGDVESLLARRTGARFFVSSKKKKLDPRPVGWAGGPVRSLTDVGDALIATTEAKEVGRIGSPQVFLISKADFALSTELFRTSVFGMLITGRRLTHYNAGTMTRRTPNLTLQPNESLDLHPHDAARLGLSDGESIEVTSRRGTVVAPVHLTDDVSPGEVFLAFHFPDVATNLLTSDAMDETTSCPEYKITAVQLRRL